MKKRGRDYLSKIGLFLIALLIMNLVYFPIEAHAAKEDLKLELKTDTPVVTVGGTVKITLAINGTNNISLIGGTGISYATAFFVMNGSVFGTPTYNATLSSENLLTSGNDLVYPYNPVNPSVGSGNDRFSYAAETPTNVFMKDDCGGADNSVDIVTFFIPVKSGATPGVYQFSFMGNDTTEINEKPALTTDYTEYNPSVNSISIQVVAAQTNHTISFDANGGTGTVTSMQVADGQTSSALPAGTGLTAPTGKKFDSWNTKADGTGTKYAAGATVANVTADMTLYAQYVEDTPQVTHTISFDVNGGTGSVSSMQVADGQTSSALPDGSGLTAPTGKKFDSWNTKADGTGTKYAAGATVANVTADMTLYAQYVEDTPQVTHTISFDANGGTGSVTSLQVADGQTSSALPDGSGLTVPTGKKFDSWNTKADGTGTKYAAGATVANVTADMTLYAQYVEDTPQVTHTISFDVNGGTGSVTSLQVADGQASSALPAGIGLTAPTGKKFDSWNTKADGTGTKYAAGATVANVTADMTLYAQYVEDTPQVTHTISFDVNGGTGSVTSLQVADGQTSSALPDGSGLTVPTGKKFDSWNTKADGTGTKYAAGATVANVTADMTLYAQYVEDTPQVTHTISFDVNGGTGSVTSMQVADGQASSALPAGTGLTAPTGKKFDSWNTKADGTGTKYAAGATVANVTADMTLYAQYVEDTPQVTHTISFDVNGGTGSVTSLQVADGQTSSALPAGTGLTAPTGKKFDSWNTKADGTGTKYAEGATVANVTADMTLYAQYVEDTPQVTHTISFDVNGGTGTVTSLQVADGQTSSALPEGTGLTAPTGKKFDSWNTKADGTGTKYAAGATVANVTADMTLYAQYVEDTPQVTHTISFDVNGGTGSVTSLQVADGQTSSALPEGTGLTAPTGKKFDSWNTKADGTGTKYAAGATVANVTADMTLYAQYVTDSSSGGGSSHSGGGSSSTSASTTIKIVTDKDSKEAVINFSSSSAKVTAVQIKDVIASNKDNNIIIKQNDVTMTFKKGTMQEVSGKTEYDFGVSFATGTLKDTIKKAAGDSFIQSLHFNYSGQLPAKATIDINLGKAYSGQTLNYNYYNPQTGKLEFKQKSTVDSNGIFTVQQSSCSDYVITKYVSATPGKLNLNVESWVNPFTDVAKSDWFYKSVAILNQNNIMGGTDASAFSPNLGTNRGMIATILYRLNGSKETFDSSFTDVTKDQYYANAVAWAQNKGIVTGYGNNIFAPNNNITREQLVSILWRYAGSPVVTDYNGIASFKDAFDISDYAKQAFAWAYQQKIISGKGDNSLDPKGLATRAEVAMMITSYAEK
ncbi:InlB B-repeat-containing protein [Aminipila terrae]|uniref:SLH domain-containing protein n=1 Tax=Aminipila terrae TaxID=2697030 RepID=A0A6P1MGB2_9FIRM|nr:InlB B-repeat-containing protein [Aminipila terrae]QHI71624.1 hypothetical protein Ami3637_03815 [Aminipila terrae]